MNKFIKEIEKKPFQLWFFLISLISIIFLRQFLETFSDIDNGFSIIPPSAFIHYSLFFLSIFFTVVLILIIFSQEKPIKIIKISLPFFTIILFPPIFDLITKGGADIAYIFDKNFNELLDLYYRFFGHIDYSPISWGMRIEIIMATIAVAVYLYIKKHKVLIALLSAWAIYTVSFIYVSLPAILTNLQIDSVSGQEINQANSFDKFYSFIFLLLITLQLSIIFIMYNRKKFSAVVKNSRPYRIVHYLLLFWAGIFFSSNFFDINFELWQLLSSFISIVLAWLAMVGLNDLIDIKIDQISNPNRPLVLENLNKNEYRNLTIFFIILAFLFSYCVSYTFLMLIIVFIIIYTLYSAPPLQIKRFPIISNFSLAIASLIIFVSGFSFSEENTLAGIPGFMIALILITFTLSFNVKDVKDIAGDKKNSIYTIPVIFDKNGKKITGLMVAVSYLLVPMIIPVFYLSLFIFSIIFGSLGYFLVNRKKYQEKYIFIEYYIYFVLLSIYIYKIYN